MINSAQFRFLALAVCVAVPGLAAAQAQSVKASYGFNTPPVAPDPTDSRMSQSNLTIAPAYTATSTTISFAGNAMDNSFGTDDGLITWSLKSSSGFQIDSMSSFVLSTSNRNFTSAQSTRYQLWGAVETNGVTSAFSLLSEGSVTGSQVAPVNFTKTGTENFSIFNNLGTSTARFRLELVDSIGTGGASPPSWALNQLNMFFQVAPVTAPVPEPSTAALGLLGGLGLVALSRRRKALRS